MQYEWLFTYVNKETRASILFDCMSAMISVKIDIIFTQNWKRICVIGLLPLQWKWQISLKHFLYNFENFTKTKTVIVFNVFQAYEFEDNSIVPYEDLYSCQK